MGQKRGCMLHPTNLNIKRRQVIKTGLAATGGLLVPQSVEAKPDPEEGQLPDSSVPTRIIEPRTHPEARVRQPVSDETWVIHQLSMYTVEDEGPSDLRRMREIPDYTISIDGETIEDPDRFWSGISQDGQTWRCTWEYAHPPHSPGDHQFKVTIDFPMPIRNRRDGGGFHVWDGTYEFGSSYEVKPAEDIISSALEGDQLQTGDDHE